MKINLEKENKKGFRVVNLYSRDTEKKEDNKKEQFLNYKLPKELNRRKFIIFVRSIVNMVKTNKQDNISFNFSQFRDISIEGLDEFWKAKLFIENIILAEYKYDKFLSQKDGRIKDICIYGSFTNEEKRGFKEGMIVAESINFTRDLANEPGGTMTPTILANTVKKEFKGQKNIKVKILEDNQTKKLKMGLYNAVGQGSKEKSKFIIIEYFNGKKTEKPIVLIGKGITFDTGGLNLKPSRGIGGMYMDMTGGATVIGTIKAINSLNIKKNVIALVPAVENAISGGAFRPGDIITAMSGKTVSIGNTDAEGRLVLADSITYAKRYNPSFVLDIATLTGAAIAALGKRASAIMSKEKSLIDDLLEIGWRTGDYVWELPLWEEFEEDMKSDFADIDNLGSAIGQAGTITAGIFLYAFAKEYKKDTKWAHIDIAPRMESIPSDNLAKGATGEPVRLLVEFVKNI